MDDSETRVLPEECAIIIPKKRDKLVARVCLPIELSDPGRILSLLRSLFENSSDILQIKINKYLAEVTKSRASFIIISFLRKKELKVSVMGQQILLRDIYIKWESELRQQLMEIEKGYKMISLELLDDKLYESVANCLSRLENEDENPIHLSSLLAVPVKHPVSGKTLLHVILINPENEVDYKRTCAGLVDECMRYCLGNVINAICYETERKEHERARNFIEIMREALLTIEDTNHMMSELRVRICDLMNCQRCNIFHRDICGGFVTKVLNFGESCELAEAPLMDIKLPEDFGLLGIVAKTGEIIICEDAQNDPRYCTYLDIKTGISTRNALCFPLWRNNETVVGAVEVYNKMSSKEGHHFTDEDVAMAEALSVLLTPLVFHSLNFRKTLQNSNRKIQIESMYLQKPLPSDDEVEAVLTCEVIHDYHEMLHLSFSQLEFQLDKHFYCFVYDCFNKLGLMKRFNIVPSVMVRFLISVFKEHPQFPFHHWKISFGTFHFITVLVNELHLVSSGILTHVEVLALLISAMCYMSDYRGALSRFQSTCGTTLGALYSSPAHINQQFQSSQIFRLLQQPNIDILENLPPDQYTVFARLLKKLINTADIGCFWDGFNSIEESLQNGLDRENFEQRISLLELLIGCSVLSDYSKDFLHCRRIAEMTYAEFMPMVEVPIVEGELSNLHITRSIELIPPLQIQFINTICIPTFRLLSELFPVTYPCYERCLENLNNWEEYADKFAELYAQDHREFNIVLPEVPPDLDEKSLESLSLKE